MKRQSSAKFTPTNKSGIWCIMCEASPRHRHVNSPSEPGWAACSRQHEMTENMDVAKALTIQRKLQSGMLPFVRRLLALLAFAGAILCASANAQRRPLQEEKIGDGILVTVLPPDAIPALTKPIFLSRVDAGRLMLDDEPVLGLVDPVNGKAKAYSLWHLDRHEIVNDRLGGKPIAVTW
jgi:hypothetical protein